MFVRQGPCGWYGKPRSRRETAICWYIDRAFRSVHEAANTLERLRGWGVGLRSYSEPWLDTTSPFGEALYYITVAHAQLEKGIIAERVRAGMARAKREGRPIGRRSVINGAWSQVEARLANGKLSLRQAAQILGVSKSTVARQLSRKGGGNGTLQTQTQ